jgi:hypothetical protein
MHFPFGQFGEGITKIMADHTADSRASKRLFSTQLMKMGLAKPPARTARQLLAGLQSARSHQGFDGRVYTEAVLYRDTAKVRGSLGAAAEKF